MALSELQQIQLKKHLATFCETRVPAAVRGKLRGGFRIKGNEAILFEERSDDHQREGPTATRA